MSDPETDSDAIVPPDDSLGTAPELAKKIAAVMGDIEDISKSGVNDYHGYQYATDDDVMGAVRPKMAEHNLVALPSLVSRDIQRFGTEGDYTLHTRIVLDITLLDADSGQQKTMRWEGEAQDTQDKGLYKAYTSAIKYFMLKVFLLSADTDVETDDISGREGAQAPPKQNGSPKQPSDKQVKYARDLAKKGVWSEKEQKALNAKIDRATRQGLSDLIDDMKGTIEERESAGPQKERQDPSQGAPEDQGDPQEAFGDPNDELPF
jgi:hypothetical protein